MKYIKYFIYILFTLFTLFSCNFKSNNTKSYDYINNNNKLENNKKFSITIYNYKGEKFQYKYNSYQCFDLNNSTLNKEGYIIDKFIDIDNFIFYDPSTYKIKSNHNFFIMYKPILNKEKVNINISFFENKVLSNISIYKGDHLFYIPTFNFKNYSFIGYYQGNEKFDLSSQIYEDKILEAKYKRKYDVTVFYNNNNLNFRLEENYMLYNTLKSYLKKDDNLIYFYDKYGNKYDLNYKVSDDIYLYVKSVSPYNLSNFYKYEVINDKVIIKGLADNTTFSSSLIIPNYINGKEVIKIADNAFANTEFSSIILPDSITYIGKKSFYNCQKLVKFHNSKNLEYIGEQAFMYCRKLKKISIPEKVKKLNKWSFYYCIKLQKVHLRNGLKEIGNAVFVGCDALNDVYIPDTVVKISEFAFAKCINLTNISLGQGLKEIGDFAFYYTSFLHIKIPKSVEVLGNKVFCSNQYLLLISLHDNINKISKDAFFDIKNIIGINIIKTNSDKKITNFNNYDHFNDLKISIFYQ